MTNRAAHPLVVMPNPFYQIYEGAALLAGAEPWYMGNDRSNAFLPDLDGVPRRSGSAASCCSCARPATDRCRREHRLPATRSGTGRSHDFVVASDECYSEIYLDEAHPPPGLLQAALAAGHGSFERCVVFHSLSKRSSVPGLRSGFVAGMPR
jgi:N-succinyldiaminopimelate aminotransferase